MVSSHLPIVVIVFYILKRTYCSVDVLIRWTYDFDVDFFNIFRSLSHIFMVKVGGGG